MTTTDQLRDLITANPATTVAIAAATLGVSRQRISQIAKANGLTLRDGRHDKASVRDIQWRNHFGGTEKLPSNFIGGASELTAAADLLRRGIPVYRSMTSVSSFDLVVEIDGILLRIEVHSARLREDGRLAFPQPKAGRYDVVALVDQHGTVTYRPNAGIAFPD